MLTDLQDLSEEELLKWIETSVREEKSLLGEGYHGAVYLYDQNNYRLVIKAPHAGGLLSWFRLDQLRNEYAIYKALSGIPGIPVCYGLLAGKYLVLEYVDGISLRTAELTDKDDFFSKYLQLIKQVHSRNVAHGDMKRKENLLVVNGSEPCFIDFGISVIRKDGFHPVNHFFFNLAKAIDFNAWVKHKYRGRYETISEQDRCYYNPTMVEKVSRRLKKLIYPLIRRG